KGVVSMEFRPLVLKLGSMTFATQAGLCRLESFDDADLQYTINQLATQAHIGKPFGWSVEVCKASAERRGVKPDWVRGYKLANQFEIDPVSPMFEKDKPFIGEPRSKGTPSSRGGVKECAKAPTQEDLQRGYRLDGGKTLKEDQRTEEQELAEFFKFVETMKDPANLWRYERFGNYMLSSSMIRAAK